MKKTAFILSIFCIMLLSFGLTACGSTYAKIVGINARVFSTTDDEYNVLLSDDSTVTENDYILQVGQSYKLRVAYSATGGSRYPLLKAESVSLKYDNEVLEIIPPDENLREVLYYNLTCKKSVAYTAILIEADGEYFDTVIISAQ